MLDFIVKYWLQTLLGLMTTGLGFLCKKFYSLYKAEQKHQRTKEQEEFCEGIKETIREVGQTSLQGDKALQEQINVLTGGVLSIQGKNFKQECRELLREGHEITLEEFETIQEEHNIYKSLGGNHDGDTLFNMVQAKTTHDLTD